MHPYLIPLKDLFEQYGDPEIAVFMKKYMRGQYAYFGIKAPVRTQIQQEFLNLNKYPPVDELPDIIRDCWEAEQREYQYFAMELVFRMIKKCGPEIIPTVEYMIVTKSWWDTVDYISAAIAGNLFSRFPGLRETTVPLWMDSGNMWLQRTCLLFQLKYRGKTDRELLASLILRLNGGKEFFINKAIGWSLRQYSKYDPAWVTEFANNNKLSGLSHREALKWLERRKKQGSL